MVIAEISKRVLFVRFFCTNFQVPSLVHSSFLCFLYSTNLMATSLIHCITKSLTALSVAILKSKNQQIYFSVLVHISLQSLVIKLSKHYCRFSLQPSASQANGLRNSLCCKYGVFLILGLAIRRISSKFINCIVQEPRTSNN